MRELKGRRDKALAHAGVDRYGTGSEEGALEKIISIFNVRKDMMALFSRLIAA